MVTSQIEQCLTGVDGGRQKKRGENEAKATTTAEFARVSFLVFPSRQTNRQQRMLAFPIFRLGIGGGEKKKLSFFFFLAFRPRSQASLACSSIFKKKKRKRLCVGHEAYSGTLTRLNSQLEIMFKFPYLALTRIISHKLAHSRHCKVDTNFNTSS